jgi:hypothetical protein
LAAEPGLWQAERARQIVRNVFVEGGAELLVCNPGGNMSTDHMVRAVHSEHHCRCQVVALSLPPLSRARDVSP